MMPLMPSERAVPDEESPESAEQERTRYHEVASVESIRHPGRNDDAGLGDERRIGDERINPPYLVTGDVEADRAAILAAGERESACAATLRERQIYGNFDGVSGGIKPKIEGGGAIASRLAAAAIAETMAAAPPPTDAESARRAIETAMRGAHLAISEYEAGRQDLWNAMSTTGDVVQLLSRPDGSAEMAFGHVGDSRILIYRAGAKAIERVTVDDSLPGDALRRGEITERELRGIERAHRADELPEHLRGLWEDSSIVMNSLGDEPSFRARGVTTGIEGLAPGDKVVLATDGLFSKLTDRDLARHLADGISAADLARMAAELPGHADDVTVQIIAANPDLAPPKPEDAASGPRRITEKTAEQRAADEQKLMDDLTREIWT
jgi:serine/threonine protein phosphatase PrpC